MPNKIAAKIRNTEKKPKKNKNLADSQSPDKPEVTVGKLPGDKKKKAKSKSKEKRGRSQSA